MIVLNIPKNNISEREYIINILFSEFLGLEYKIEILKDILEVYEIILENGNKLIFEDHFFSKYPNDLEYLNAKNIPEILNFIRNDFIIEDNIPVIFGNSALNIQHSTLKCGIDIFASSFFMLTRWEEYSNKKRDNHGRFPANESLAYKQGILDRPIVNEYVEMLKTMLIEMGISQKFKINNYNLFLTHDVDELYMWQNWKHVFRVAIGDIIKRNNFALACERIAEFFLIQRAKILDPFDTFDWLMDRSEAIGLKSRFYFMVGGVTKYDGRYKIDEEKCVKLIKKIIDRGHIIGIHPSYDSYKDFEQFKKEKDLLEKVSEQKIIEGREHYLRFEVPTTWQIWEDYDMQIDNTCGYADKEGFRCGTGNEFSVFNILNQNQLKLKERPLIVMDSSLFDYQNLSYQEVKDNIKKLQKNEKNFTILWHNSYLKHMNFYKELLEQSFQEIYFNTLL